MFKIVLLNIIAFMFSMIACVAVIIGGMAIGTNFGFLIRRQYEEINTPSFIFGMAAIALYAIYVRFLSKMLLVNCKTAQITGSWCGIALILGGFVYFTMK